MGIWKELFAPENARPLRCFSVLADGGRRSNYGQKAEEQKGFIMTINRFSVRFRALALVGVAVVSVTSAGAQNDNASVSNASCADVKPPVPTPQDSYGNVPLYLIPPGAPQHQSVCEATEALAAGMVAVSLGDDSVLADALGDPEPETVTGQVGEFPYSTPGSTPTPGQPPPGPAPERTEGSHVYAAFIAPKSGVEYTYSSVADSLADMKATVAEWITSTVEPLLEQDASNAIAPAASNARFAATAEAAIEKPNFDPRAWNLLIDQTIDMPDQRSLIQEHGMSWDKPLGSSGETVRVYRLNGNQANNDYFLVDTAYTQTPTYKPFEFSIGFIFHGMIWAWANERTGFTLTATDPNHTAVTPALYDFSPRTKVTASEETFTVGANLGGDVNASYSVTKTQESVVTTVIGTLGRGTLAWTDEYSRFGIPTYNGGIVTPPNTSINSFNGERLAIFQVPRTINDNIPAGRQAGLRFTPSLASYVQGCVVPVCYIIHQSWNLAPSLFAPEPQFSASPISLEVSKSKNSAGNPAIVNVLAQLPDGGQQVTWLATLPPFLGSNLGASGIKGSGQLKVYATNSAVAGESGFILLDSSPSAATDSLRNGPLQIPVHVVP
jgi:hypothetical protein